MKSLKGKTLIKGKISIASKGYGFVEPSDKSHLSQDVFIPRAKIQSASDQDLVEVQITSWKDKTKGPEGEVIRIIKRTRNNLIGTVIEKNSNGYIAHLPSIGTPRNAIVESNKKLKQGDRILIEVKDWTDEFSPIIGSCVKIFGNMSDPSTDIPVAAEEFNIPSEFSKEALKEASQFEKNVTQEDLKNRVDLTKRACITIDPDTAKDYDDAVSCIKDEKGHFHLGVHIADVSYYVKAGSHLDEDALKRGNSTYFPGACIPMLSFELSNELCSLKEKVVRLCISVDMEFDKNGDLINYVIFRSYIKSKKRLTYKEAFEIIQKKKKSPFSSLLDTMVELCYLLKKKRTLRGGLDFSVPEDVVEVDENSSPIGIKIVEYDISHQLIEEFMLKANELVAIHLHEKGVKQIFRIHDKPSSEAIKEFHNLASTLGFDVPENYEDMDLNKFFEEAKESSFYQQLSVNFIRSLKMAFYLPHNIGHFGLALDFYCHFTSPIRRYSDLVTHRLLFNEQPPESNLDEISKICSEKERNSFRAENSVTYIKKLRLLEKIYKDDPTRKYKAVITKVKPYNFNFEIREFFIEGSIHISEIYDDYYIYNPDRMALEGRRTNRTFAYGDELFVKIDRIDLLFLKVQWRIDQIEKKGKKKEKPFKGKFLKSKFKKSKTSKSKIIKQIKSRKKRKK